MSLATFHRRKSGGHYARVMGTLHRHLKVEQAGDAALGMLTRIWSYCADTGREVLTERDMAVIMVRDKNGPRKLAALISARLLDRVPGGYTPHDWFDHNPGLSSPSSGVTAPSGVHGEENATGNVTTNVTENVSKPVEQNQTLTQSLSRPKTQDPREEEEKREEKGDTGDAARPDGAAAPPPSAPAPKRKAPRCAEREALTAAVKRLAGEHGHVVPPAVSSKHAQAGAAKVAGLVGQGAALPEAAERVARAAYGLLATGRPSSFSWAMHDCVIGPAAAPRQPAGRGRPGRLEMSPGTTANDFAGAPDVDDQLTALGL